MNCQLFLSLLLVAATQATPLKVSGTKAASPYVNIGCQCSPLSFVDQYGAIQVTGGQIFSQIFSVCQIFSDTQGNCKSVDSTGARWCYVASGHSSCQDLRFSARFPSNPWSYEACATPLPYAPVAPVAPLAPVVPPHTHLPSAPLTAPVHQPVHSHPVHSHPVQPVYGSNVGTLPADYLGKLLERSRRGSSNLSLSAGQFIPKKAGDAGSASKDAINFS